VYGLTIPISAANSLQNRSANLPSPDQRTQQKCTENAQRAAANTDFNPMKADSFGEELPVWW
jgi:hypothetical protein